MIATTARRIRHALTVVPPLFGALDVGDVFRPTSPQVGGRGPGPAWLSRPPAPDPRDPYAVLDPKAPTSVYRPHP